MSAAHARELIETLEAQWQERPPKTMTDDAIWERITRAIGPDHGLPADELAEHVAGVIRTVRTARARRWRGGTHQ